MRLLLVEPFSELLRPPQCLHYIACAVRPHHPSVLIHDESLFRDPSTSLDRLLATDADVYGISVYTKADSIRRAEQISSAVKSKRPSAVVVWGGWHPTLYGRECFQSGAVDVVVRGPGEKVTCDLLTALAQHASLENVPNILFRERGAVVETPSAATDEAYLLPPLDYDIIAIERYVRDHDQGGGRLGYLTSRGCYGRCAFCASRLVDHRRRIRKPRDQCIDELRYVVKRHDVRHIVFSDAVGFANRRELEDLVDIVRSVGGGKRIAWRCDGRVDVMARLPDEAYKTAAESGCTGFAIGIESGVDRVLELMHKDIRAEQIAEVLDRLSVHHLDGNLFWFMTGFPGETAEEALQTVSVACQTRMRFPRSNIVLNPYDARLAGNGDGALGGHASAGLSERHVARVSYYLGASVQANAGGKGPGAVMRLLRQKLALRRIRRKHFGIPIEYCVARWRDALRSGRHGRK